MFPRCAMIIQADSHDVSLMKNIIVKLINIWDLTYKYDNTILILILFFYECTGRLCDSFHVTQVALLGNQVLLRCIKVFFYIFLVNVLFTINLLYCS